MKTEDRKSRLDSRPGAAARDARGGPMPGKISIPKKVDAHLDRASLVSEAMPTNRRLTLFKAPAGFGKTTLLAECCRDLVDRGIPTAWISIDERDNVEELCGCIALAFGRAGVEMREIAENREIDTDLDGVELTNRILAMRSGPFVLAFDDADLLTDPESLALLDRLLYYARPNLHLALTCREFPVGLNVGKAYLEGLAAMFDQEDLRFSQSEVTEIFGLAQLKHASKLIESGWPIAVRFACDWNRPKFGNEKALANFAANWMDTRFFGRLSPTNRELLFDIGLFEQIEEGLLEEVLRDAAVPRRVRELQGPLEGLLWPMSGDGVKRWQLHPLIRSHCARRRFQQTPERFADILIRLAKAHARRGETVTAMRHAIDAGDRTLAEDILEEIGAAGVLIGRGLQEFVSANRLLNETSIANRPRLRLFRSLGQAFSGNFESARRGRAAAESEIGDDGRAISPALDKYVVRGNFVLCGGERIGSGWIRDLSESLSRFKDSGDLAQDTLAYLEFMLAGAYQIASDFDSAREQAESARDKVRADDNLLTSIELEIGQIDMAQGRAADAEQRYSRTGPLNRKKRPGDAELRACGRILLEELALECNRLAFRPHLLQAPRMLALVSKSFSAQAAAVATAIDLNFRYRGLGPALDAATYLANFYRDKGSPSLTRLGSALRAALLAETDSEGAERYWRSNGLPEDADECLDLAGQTWREMEAVSCARLRMLSALGRLDEALAFAGELRDRASERGLRRTLMRALPLSAMLAWRAGDKTQAVAHLSHYLRDLEKTPYVWPAVRDHESLRPIMRALVDSRPNAAISRRAKSLLPDMREPGNSDRPLMSGREFQVLEYLETHQDKEIARILGLSPYGVRYHIRKIFSKLNVNNKADAARRARELGLLVGRFT